MEFNYLDTFLAFLGMTFGLVSVAPRLFFQPKVEATRTTATRAANSRRWCAAASARAARRSSDEAPASEAGRCARKMRKASSFSGLANAQPTSSRACSGRSDSRPANTLQPPR